ncbi:MFS transporter [Microbaculum marinum]|uniref:MFS transporter n=1 Tax=Microbaculum marinum TaxID=1764581 RepID=A0AAW9RPE1_9HYPH
MTPARRNRLIAAGTIGNVLEWYDFAIYGYLAFAIGHNFFPQIDATARVLAAFGVFAIGYFMRPIGGVVIGHIGDRYGRRAALTWSVVLMAVPTFLIGLMPTYAAIGLAAPLLLTLLRMLQGLSVGGEYTSSMVFLVEQARTDRRAFYGAFSVLGAVGGILLGSAVAAALTAALSPDQVEAWGWRIPFLFGPLIGVAGYLLRRQMAHSMPEAHRFVHPPVVEAFRDHWRLILRIAGMSMINAVGFYVMFVYVADWMQSADGIAPARALEINTINMVLLLPVILGGALLSDRIGRKPVMMTSVALVAVAAWPLFWLMHHPNGWLAFLGQFGFVLALGGFFACNAAVLIEAVPRAIRCTTVSLGYNICLGLAGGTAPLVAAWLVARTDYQPAPAFYVIAAAVVSLVSLTSFRETYRSPLPA